MKRLLTLITCTGLATAALAQPTFDSPSPTAGSGTSETANQMADKGMYKPI